MLPNNKTLAASTTGAKMPLPAAPAAINTAKKKEGVVTTTSFPLPKRYNFDDNGGGYRGL